MLQDLNQYPGLTLVRQYKKITEVLSGHLYQKNLSYLYLS